jgi:glycosyltransferase involved in cell wall biosynthesis
MNILVLSHLYPRPQDPSYGIFVHRQVKQLQKFGHNVIVLSPIPWVPKFLPKRAKWRTYDLTPPEFIWEGVKVYSPCYLRLPGAWFRTLAGFTIYRSVIPLVATLHKNSAFDVIHSNVLLPDGLVGILLGRQLNLPTICTVRGSDATTFPYENALNLYHSKKVIRESDQIVAVSHTLKELVESLAKSPKGIRVVYNGVDTKKFHIKQTSSELNQIAPIDPYILFVGRDIRRKGLIDLMSAFVELVDKIEHKLIVIGPTSDEVRMLSSDLTTLASGRLIIPGCMSPDSIPPYMQNCELFVLPSYSEGLPNVVLEAMACGKPVIATNVMGIPEAVINNVTGLLIEPGDTSTLAEVILSLTKDPERCREMGRRGRKRVEKEFTWEISASKLISIYNYISEEYKRVVS